MRKLLNIGLISLVMLGCANGFTRAQVLTGLDNLVAGHFTVLKGKRVGLITNQTGRTRSGDFGPHLFATQKTLRLVALYSPEHGLMGERLAGVASDAQEVFEGVPVFSLYGTARKPTKSMLKGVSALVFDIQDAGVRPYTFLSTMLLSMEAAAENGIPFYVLDRPNPLSGDRVEGNVLDTSLRSFVGQVPVPYLHGMTFGELAKMAKAKNWFHAAAKLKLTVIPMTNWKRSMYWPETGLTWIAPSPNVPHFENAVGLAMLGATGELGVLSVGIGTDTPFLRIGSNLVTSDEILRAAHAAFPIEMASDEYTATTSAGTKTFHGVKFTLPDDLSTIPSIYEGQYRLLAALLKNDTFRASMDALSPSVQTMYEKVTGVRGILNTIETCGNIETLLSAWHAQANTFRVNRKPYLLY